MAIQSGVNCSFMIGRNLMKSGKPFLVSCFGDEFFAFELSPRQATRLGIVPNTLVSARGLQKNSLVPRPAPTIWLEQIEVNQAAAIDRGLPISGTLRYRTDQFTLDPLALRIFVEPPGRTNRTDYFHLIGLRPPEGTLQFSVAPLGDLLDRSEMPFASIFPLFFQIWTTVDPLATGIDSFPILPAAGKPFSQPKQPVIPQAWQPVSPFQSLLRAPMQPATSTYPPPYDPIGQAITTPQAQHEKPISDIRAVLVEIAER